MTKNLIVFVPEPLKDWLQHFAKKQKLSSYLPEGIQFDSKTFSEYAEVFRFSGEIVLIDMNIPILENKNSKISVNYFL